MSQIENFYFCLVELDSEYVKIFCFKNIVYGILLCEPFKIFETTLQILWFFTLVQCWFSTLYLLKDFHLSVIIVVFYH